ncbi:hypothetical protein G8761_15065 [Bacillus sp. C11]|nr:hypothetical protein [Neobacillus terrae]
MKKWKVYIPATIILVFCGALIAYEFYVSPTGGSGHGPQQSGDLAHKGQRFQKNSLREIFNWFGTMSIIGGAITYSLVRFKKKLKSPSPFIKKFSKAVFRVHNVIGYAILILGISHGTYYLITEKLTNKGVLNGIAAFILILTVGVYGFLIRRLKNKYTKKVHFWVSNASLTALLIHAGGSFIGPAIGTLAVWGIFELAEKNILKKRIAEGEAI